MMLRTAARCSGVSVASRSASPRAELSGCHAMVIRESPFPQITDPFRKPVRKPLADLDCKPLPDGGPDGVALLGREHLKPLRKPVCKLLPQLVRKPLPDDAADGGALLGCEHDGAALPGCDCADAPAIPSVRAVAASANFFIVPSSILPNAITWVANTSVGACTIRVFHGDAARNCPLRFYRSRTSRRCTDG